MLLLAILIPFFFTDSCKIILAAAFSNTKGKGNPLEEQKKEHNEIAIKSSTIIQIMQRTDLAQK